MNDDQQLLFDQYLSTGFAQAYGPASIKSTYYQRMFARNIGPHLPANVTAQVVDIGCGLGHFLYYLLQNGYTNVLGVDIGAEPVAFCQQHITPNVLQIDSIETFLAARPGPYDVIGFFDVIEHLPKPTIIPTLRLMRDHLAPGGVLFIRTGNMSSPIGPRVRFGDFTHEVGFTEFSLGQVLNAAGFQSDQFSLHPYEPPAPRNLKQRVRVGLHKLAQLLWRGIFIVEASPPPRITAELIMAVARRPL
jgi:SAM-dependent methyltransferase